LNRLLFLDFNWAFAIPRPRRANPNSNPNHHPFVIVMQQKSPTINHFYEKLLKLKSLMKTEAGKKIAEKRHEFMQAYLDQFHLEIDGLC
jgi:hypothetical protein